MASVDLPPLSEKGSDSYYRLVGALDAELAALPNRQQLALLLRVYDTLAARLDGEDEQPPEPSRGRRKRP